MLCKMVLMHLISQHLPWLVKRCIWIETTIVFEKSLFFPRFFPVLLNVVPIQFFPILTSSLVVSKHAHCILYLWQENENQYISKNYLVYILSFVSLMKIAHKNILFWKSKIKIIIPLNHISPSIILYQVNIKFKETIF